MQSAPARLALISTLLSTSIATPVVLPSPQTTVTRGASFRWTITNYDIGCSPGGCAYRFNISAPATNSASAFATYCYETIGQEGYAACLDSQIESDVVPIENGTQTLSVERYEETTQGGGNEFSYGTVTKPCDGYETSTYGPFVVETKEWDYI